LNILQTLRTLGRIKTTEIIFLFYTLGIINNIMLETSCEKYCIQEKEEEPPFAGRGEQTKRGIRKKKQTQK